MLSTKTLSSSGQASHYFMGSDNYYQKDSIEAKDQSAWYGKGADALGLEGKVDSEQFNELLEGRLPSGQELGVIKDGNRKHRPGFDLTFSVPKSVSIVGLMGNDSRVLKAIHQSVDKVLAVIEKEAAQARTTSDGDTTYENTENIVAAKFLHDLSRECDPQLHVHTVVMNMTQRQDGKWRALASQMGTYGQGAQKEVNGFIERVRHNKKYYGLLFNSELAMALKELGYELEVNKKTGNFEIAGISEQSLRTFSQRREQIETMMNEKGFTSAKAAAMVTLTTRKNKEEVNRDVLRTEWQARCDVKGVDTFTEAKNVVEQSQQPKSERSPEKTIADYDTALLTQVLTDFSRDHSTFSENQLMNELLRTQLDRFIPIEAARDFLQQQINHNQLFVRETEQGDTVYITSQRVGVEKNIVLKASSSRERLSEWRLEKLEKALNGHDHQAIRQALRSEALIHGVEYVQEQQKLDAIVPLIKLSQAAGLQPLILSPSSKASQKVSALVQSQHGWLKQFISNLTDNSQTLTVSKFRYCMENEVFSSFFNGHEGAFIIEDAQRLSMEDMHDLIHIAEKTNSKIIPLFNRKGMKHWSNSQPIELLQKSGMQFEILSKSESAENPVNREVSASSVKVLQDHILEHDSEEKALEALAVHTNNFVRSNINAKVVLPNRSLAKQFEAITREKLLEHGLLSQEHIIATQLQPVYLKPYELASSSSYKVGMVVRFNEHYPSLGVGKEEYLQVIDAFHRKNQVLLKTASGKNITWNPNQVGGRKKGAVEVYSETMNAIHLGEKLKLNRSVRYKHLVSGDTLTVTGVSDKKITALTEKGKSVTFDLANREEQHHGYYYSDTAYQSLHSNTDVILTYHSGQSSPIANNMLHSLMTHRDKTLWCYTTDSEKLQTQFEKSFPISRYALDYVIEPNSNNNYVTAVRNALLAGIKNHLGEHDCQAIAGEAIDYAMKHLAEREAAFTQNDLLSVALKSVLGDAAPHELHEALRVSETSGHLVPGIVSVDGKLWTTKEAISQERELLLIAKDGVNKLSPVCDLEHVTSHLAQTMLSPEQKQAITTLCTNTNQVIPIQGLAGVGKTTLMKAFVELCQQHHHSVIVLAPTHTAVKELRANGLEAQTLDAFLKSSERDATKLPTQKAEVLKENVSFPIFILDEATMASTKRQLALAKIVQQRAGKFIPVGDVFQFSSIEAGKAHEQYQTLGLDVIKMTDIQRQRDNPELLSAVKSTYQLNYKEAFERLDQRFIEVGEETLGGKTFDNAASRLALMAEHYLAKAPEDRAQTLMITLSNDERKMLNEKVREGLAAEGSLDARALPSSILIAKDMTQVELTRANNYAVNDVVLFGTSKQELGVKKGEYLTVIKKNHSQNVLTLQRENSEQVVFKLPSGRKKVVLPLSVYQRESRELRVGEMIRWTKSSPELNLLSPELALVTHLEKNAAVCRPITITKAGITLAENTVNLSLTEQHYAHWDYAYAVTNYATQGRSITSVSVSLPSQHPKLTTQRAFLVALTRAVADINIYTDNKGQLLSHLLATPGDKTSALEAVGETKALDRRSVLENEKTSHQNTKTIDRKAAIQHETAPHIDAVALRESLNTQAEFLAISLLGEPKERQGNSLRFGANKGSLIVTTRGERQGLWYDFQTGEGGDMLSLFANHKGLQNTQDYPKLLSEASHFLGVDVHQMQHETSVKKPSTKAQVIDKSDPKNWSEYQRKQVAKANKLAQESQPMKGTLVESYLKNHRKIDLKIWPENIRFHPNIYCAMNKKSYPAMLLLGRDKLGNIQVVQATFLDQATKNKPEKLPVPKQSIGVISGAAVHLSTLENKDSLPGSSQKTYLAEGAETGLSALMADQKNEVKVTLGQSNFHSAHKLNLHKNVVFCFDNDAKSSPENRFKDEANKLIAEGKTVAYLKPEKAGHDLNDVLKEGGINKVRALIKSSQYFDMSQKTRANHVNNQAQKNRSSLNAKSQATQQLMQEKHSASLQISPSRLPQKDLGRER